MPIEESFEDTSPRTPPGVGSNIAKEVPIFMCHVEIMALASGEVPSLAIVGEKEVSYLDLYNLRSEAEIQIVKDVITLVFQTGIQNDCSNPRLIPSYHGNTERLRQVWRRIRQPWCLMELGTFGKRRGPYKFRQVPVLWAFYWFNGKGEAFHYPYATQQKLTIGFTILKGKGDLAHAKADLNPVPKTPGEIAALFDQWISFAGRGTPVSSR